MLKSNHFFFNFSNKKLTFDSVCDTRICFKKGSGHYSTKNWVEDLFFQVLWREFHDKIWWKESSFFVASFLSRLILCNKSSFREKYLLVLNGRFSSKGVHTTAKSPLWSTNWTVMKPDEAGRLSIPEMWHWSLAPWQCQNAQNWRVSLLKSLD